MRFVKGNLGIKDEEPKPEPKPVPQPETKPPLPHEPKIISESEVKPATKPTFESKPKPQVTVQPQQKPSYQNTAYQNPKTTALVFRDTEKPKPTTQPISEKPATPSFLKKHKPAIVAVSIVLAVAIVITFVANTIANNNIANNNIANSRNDNLHKIKSVNDITSISEISVGDHLKFGAYEQDNDTANGKEVIEWRVLAVEDDRVLLISEYLLDYMQYNDKDASVTWKTCTLRKWMNEDFLNEAFTSSEQNKIATTTFSNPDIISYGPEGINDVQDKVFALSIDEVRKYFSTDRSMIAYMTDYAHSIYGNGWSASWWLRSPGNSMDNYAMVVSRHDAYDDINTYDSINVDGLWVFSHNVAVRPALWLNL